MRGWPPIVLVACLASLAGWEPVRRAEQSLGPMLAIGEALWAPLAPEVAGPFAEPDEVEAAARAWRSYLGAVRGRGDVALPGRDVLLAPVVDVEVGERRRRLTIAVPEAGVPDGALVTHRGAFVGLVVDVEEGRATVALVGDDRLRAIAAEWQAAPTARPVHFLLASEGGEGKVASRSSSVAPQEGQVAWTRAVADLGDDLPSGLLLGRVTSRIAGDVPGGAEHGLAATRELELEPFLAPEELGVVTVEVLPGTEAPSLSVDARRLVTCGRDAVRARLDVGSRHGVEPGAWVVSDGVWLGRVDVAGWASSSVVRDVPRGTLLVIDPDGRVIPCRPDVSTWPEGWAPTPGAAVVTGHVRVGGLLVGHVASVDDAGFTIAPAAVRDARHVTVVER